MKNFKKILMVLFVILMLSPVSYKAFASSDTVSAPIKVEIQTDKTSYKAWNVATITATVTNTGSEDVNNVTAQAVFDELAPAGKRNSQTRKTVDVLKAGESFSFTYKATLNAKKHNLNIFEKIFLWIVRLFNGGYTAGASELDYTTVSSKEVKFGKYFAENIIEVGYEKEIIDNDEIVDNSNSTDVQNELLNMAKLNGGEVPNITLNSGVPSFISGKYSDKKVVDYQTAISSLNDIKNLMMIKDVETEFVEKSVSSTTIKLQQVYNNIPVDGNTLTIKTDGQGNIECLFGHYIPNLNINTTPTITETEAIRILKEQGYTVGECQGLIIYANTGYTPQLVYEIRCGGMVDIFVSAEDGQIVSSEENIFTLSSSGLDKSGIVRQFETVKNEETYLLKDSNRGITVFSDNNLTTIQEINNISFYGDLLRNATVITSSDNTWNNADAVQAMYLAKNAWDFYNREIKTTAFNNGQLSTINVVIDFSQRYKNAFSATDPENLTTTYLCIGDGEDYLRAHDVLYHEFTHSIIRATCNLDYINQSGAINESYADIIGNLIENKNDEGAWLIGEDCGTIRNMKSPNEYGQPEKVDDDYMHKYCYKNHNHSDAGCDKGGVHTNSGIINKAAYLMWKNGISNKTRLAQLFVTSLEYMDEQSNFLDCRAAVLMSAKKLNMFSEEIEIIKEAFNDVGIAQDENWIGLLNGTLKGRILDSITNEPILDAQIVALKTSPNTWGAGIAYPNENGEFSVNLSYGTYTISVFPNETDISKYKECVLEGVVIDKWETNDIGVIYLQRTGEQTGTASVHGTVIDKDTQQAIQNMKTMLYSQETQTTLTTYTNEEGVFNFENLPAGEYTVSFEHEEYSTNETATITVTQGVMFVFTDYFEFQKAEARAIIASGNCGADGDNVTWVLYADGELVISGSGEMKSYSGYSVPWDSNRDYIKKVTIKVGVTSIGDFAFYNCTSLESVTIGDSVTSIGGYAFEKCTSLESVTIGDSVTSIGDYAFKKCTSLESVTIGDSVTSIGEVAFCGCTSLESVTIGDSVTSIGGYAFSGCTSLESVTIGDSVTSIGGYAFRGCTSLKSITIPDGVTSIGNYAFYGCTSLESVTIGDSVTSIGEAAFRGCTSLKSITIPDGVTYIGEAAFHDCESLISITIPDSVTSIGAYAFEYCKSLESVTIPDGVTSIGGYTFYSCTSLASVTIGDSVTSIGGDAFRGCTSLKSITIPDGVTSIGGYTFYSCTSLASVTIGDSVTSIGDFAFEYCRSLKSITIPDGVTSIGDFAFGYCTSLESVTIGDSVTSIGNKAFLRCTSLESVTIGNGVTSIGDSAFESCTSLTSIIIPDGVTSISDDAFFSCSSLASITIPDGVTSIGVDAFGYCTSLASITIPDSVTSIGASAFYSCTNLNSVYISDIANWCEIDFENASSNPLVGSTTLLYLNGELLTDVVIPDGVKSIGHKAFSGCSRLKSITIPDSVTSIGDFAFEYCTSLESVTIPDGVTSIGDYTFYSCTSLASITIPDSVTSIGYYAFEKCTSLASITIPDSVTSIGSGAFEYCTSLTSITIPDGVTSIGYRAFSGCSSLASITIPDGVTYIGEFAFCGCTSLESITIPDGVTSIGSRAFYNCTSLESVTIPDGVTSIGGYTFYSCTSLESVTIGNGVTSIGDYTFEHCTSLTDVYYTGTVEEWNNISIGSSNTYLTNATIHYNS